MLSVVLSYLESWERVRGLSETHANEYLCEQSFDRRHHTLRRSVRVVFEGEACMGVREIHFI